MKKLIIVSGLSGAGKSIALHALEDAGFYCMDNIPLEVIKIITSSDKELIPFEKIAISIDARSLLLAQPQQLSQYLEQIKKFYSLTVIFMTANPTVIAQRYIQTRRPHPLMWKYSKINEAIEEEIQCLLEVAQYADTTINTSDLNQHQLRYQIRTKLLEPGAQLQVLLQSFGFKHAIPPNSNYVVDVRCLPNPYWEPHLQELDGTDIEVIRFLDQQAGCNQMFEKLIDSIGDWVEMFVQTGKESLVISIGCMGGQHRSVYMVNRLHQQLENSPSCTVKTQHLDI